MRKGGQTIFMESTIALKATTFDLVVSSPVILPTSILAPSILARPARISFEYRGRSRSYTGIRFVDVQAIAEERVTITSESSRLDSSRVGVQISLSVHVVMVICVLDNVRREIAIHQQCCLWGLDDLGGDLVRKLDRVLNLKNSQVSRRPRRRSIYLNDVIVYRKLKKQRATQL